MRKLAVALAVLGALAGSAAYAQEKPAGPAKSEARGKTVEKAGGQPLPPAVVVLVPLKVGTDKNLGRGCWARLFESENYYGDMLTLVGPVDLPNLRTGLGVDWTRKYQSVIVGPRARLVAYDNENYRDRSAAFRPGQQVPKLEERMGFFEEIESLRINCVT